MLKLYKTYNKAKDVFVKPKLMWYFGKWRHDPCLPVWRRGPIWWIGGSSYKANSKCYQIYNQVPVKTHSKGDLKPDGTVYLLCGKLNGLIMIFDMNFHLSLR